MAAIKERTLSLGQAFGVSTHHDLTADVRHLANGEILFNVGLVHELLDLLWCLRGEKEDSDKFVRRGNSDE